MTDELDITPWTRAEELLQNLTDSDEFRDLEVEARCARVNEVTDKIILTLVKTKLMEAERKTDFIRFQSMVASLLVLRSAINGKIASGGKNGL